MAKVTITVEDRERDTGSWVEVHFDTPGNEGMTPATIAALAVIRFLQDARGEGFEELLR